MPKSIKIGQCFTELFKNKSDTFLWTAVSLVILFLHSSTSSSNNKEHFIAVFKY